MPKKNARENSQNPKKLGIYAFLKYTELNVKQTLIDNTYCSNFI